MKIAVMGSNPATKMQAPFGDPDWKIWACSPHNFSQGRLPRVDEWFELHVPAQHKTRPDDYLEWVRDEVSMAIPVWARDMAFFPAANQYPEIELKRRFGRFFFTSSIAYIMAKAIADISDWMGPSPTRKKEMEPTIGIWGVMQASPNEFSYQRPGIQYFIQQAHNAGITVVAPPESRLFDVVEMEW